MAVHFIFQQFVKQNIKQLKYLILDGKINWKLFPGQLFIKIREKQKTSKLLEENSLFSNE